MSDMASLPTMIDDRLFASHHQNENRVFDTKTFRAFFPERNSVFFFLNKNSLLCLTLTVAASLPFDRKRCKSICPTGPQSQPELRGKYSKNIFLQRQFDSSARCQFVFEIRLSTVAVVILRSVATIHDVVRLIVKTRFGNSVLTKRKVLRTGKHSQNLCKLLKL